MLLSNIGLLPAGLSFIQTRIERWFWAILPEVERPETWPPPSDTMLKDLGDVGAMALAMYDMLSKFAYPKEHRPELDVSS